MTTNEQRPRWRRNIGGIRGAVGYRDSQDQVIIVVNWLSLLTRPKINISGSKHETDRMQSSDFPHEDDNIAFR